MAQEKTSLSKTYVPPFKIPDPPFVITIKLKKEIHIYSVRPLLNTVTLSGCAAWECCSNLRLHPIQLTFILLLLIFFFYLFIYSCIELCIVLYCIVLHCIALYCIVLHCIVLYCIVLYCIVLYYQLIISWTVISVVTQS